jgi:hypothetical protein
MIGESFLDAPGVGGSDALVDGQCLLQAGAGFAGAAVLEVSVAGSFQGACFFQGHADLAGEGQRLGVVVAGLLGRGGPGRQLAEAVEHFGLAVPFAEVAEQVKCLLVAGCGGSVVAGQR